MTPRPPIYPPYPIGPNASAAEVERHEEAMTHYARMRRERTRDTLIEMLAFVVSFIVMAVVGVAAVVFGEHVMWWFLGVVGALFFGGMCWFAVSIAKDLYDMRGGR